jgi:hypothetical protein
MTDLWISYFKKLKECSSKGTEHTPRTVLENIIEDVKLNKKLKITQEPKTCYMFRNTGLYDGKRMGY